MPNNASDSLIYCSDILFFQPLVTVDGGSAVLVATIKILKFAGKFGIAFIWVWIADNDDGSAKIISEIDAFGDQASAFCEYYGSLLLFFITDLG